MDYVERTDNVTVPKNTGIEGLLRLLKDLLQEIPRIKLVQIHHNGKVEYTWYAPSGAPEKPLAINFEDLKPYAVIRNSVLVEVKSPQGSDATTTLMALLTAAKNEHLCPICFAVGAQSKVYRWLGEEHGVVLQDGDNFMGCRFISDREIPDNVIILCASYARSDFISDTYRCYKTSLEEYRRGTGSSQDGSAGGAG